MMSTIEPWPWLYDWNDATGLSLKKDFEITMPFKTLSRECGCIGPQNGEPRCPCQMPAYREEQAGREALFILRHMTNKPRIRVKAVTE